MAPPPQTLTCILAAHQGTLLWQRFVLCGGGIWGGCLQGPRPSSCGVSSGASQRVAWSCPVTRSRARLKGSRQSTAQGRRRPSPCRELSWAWGAVCGCAQDELAHSATLRRPKSPAHPTSLSVPPHCLSFCPASLSGLDASQILQAGFVSSLVSTPGMVLEVVGTRGGSYLQQGCWCVPHQSSLRGPGHSSGCPPGEGC